MFCRCLYYAPRPCHLIISLAAAVSAAPSLEPGQTPQIADVVRQISHLPGIAHFDSIAQAARLNAACGKMKFLHPLPSHSSNRIQLEHEMAPFCFAPCNPEPEFVHDHARRRGIDLPRGGRPQRLHSAQIGHRPGTACRHDDHDDHHSNHRRAAQPTTAALPNISAATTASASNPGAKSPRHQRNQATTTGRGASNGDSTGGGN